MLIHFPPRRIVVPIDFSPPSNAALRLAAELGGLFGSELQLVTVLDTSPGPAALGVGDVALPPGPPLNPAAISDLRRKLVEAAKSYKGGVSVRALVGPPAATIAKLARPRHGDLVVMGTHGYQWPARLVYGSVAEAVVSRARIPVLTVRGPAGAFALRSILCPVNMTPYSAVALSYASLAAQAAGARLTALYVPPEASWSSDAALLLGRFLQETLGPAALSVRAAVGRGEPRAEIVRHAAAGKFDVVVLSAHRRPWSTDAIFGTTAQRIIRQACVPVLTVPALGGR